MSKTSDYMAKNGLTRDTLPPSRAQNRKSWLAHPAFLEQCSVCWQPSAGKGQGKRPYCKDHLPLYPVQHREKRP